MKEQPLLVLGKIAAILDAFTLVEPVRSVAEIRAITGLPTSTTHQARSQTSSTTDSWTAQATSTGSAHGWPTGPDRPTRSRDLHRITHPRS